MRLPGRPLLAAYGVMGPITTFLRRGWPHHDRQVTVGEAFGLGITSPSDQIPWLPRLWPPLPSRRAAAPATPALVPPPAPPAIVQPPATAQAPPARAGPGRRLGPA